jgi:hypothetical protein
MWIHFALGDQKKNRRYNDERKAPITSNQYCLSLEAPQMRKAIQIGDGGRRGAALFQRAAELFESVRAPHATKAAPGRRTPRRRSHGKLNRETRCRHRTLAPFLKARFRESHYRSKQHQFGTHPGGRYLFSKSTQWQWKSLRGVAEFVSMARSELTYRRSR